MKNAIKVCLVSFLFMFVTSISAFATEIVGFDEYGFLDQYGNYIENQAEIDQFLNESLDEDLDDDPFEFSPDYLSGDTRLACEAILCLSSGTRPSECSPSLSRYFSIKKIKWSKTIKARLNFLKLCPVGADDPAIASLLNTLSRTGGMCDAEGLNENGQWITQTTNIGNCYGAKDVKGVAATGKTYSITYKQDAYDGCTKIVTYWQVSTQTPSECAELWNHAYTYFPGRPQLVRGINPWDTHWVESE